MESAEIPQNSENNEISIWLDRYEDLFSEYDSSDYKGRTLSDTFLTEIRKLVKKTPSNNIELKFNLMQDTHNAETEGIILSNIHDYFIGQAQAAKAVKKAILHHGIISTAGGFALIISLLFLTHNWDHITILKGLEMLLDPFGWFLIWTGLDSIFVQADKEQPAIDFNMKMANAKLTFLHFGLPANFEMPADPAEEMKLAS